MKHINLLLVLITFLSLLTCERDDLCAETTPTTPSFVINFFNNTNQEAAKNVSNLYVFNATNGVLPDYTLVSTNKLILPLRTDQDSTTFILVNSTVLNSNDEITSGNQDSITINYSRENVYVSRACGYKTIFKDVTITIDEGTDGLWILNTEALNDNLTIENETSTHYSFFH